MGLIHNERAKLSATFLNNIAVVVTGSGLIAPFLIALYGVDKMSSDQIRLVGLAAPFWVVIGVGLHILARAVLRGLME